MPKGEIVLIPFPFTNLSDTKIRPCLVLVEAEYDVTVSFITTQTGWSDKPLNKLATLDMELIIGKIRALRKEIITVNQKLKKNFSFKEYQDLCKINHHYNLHPSDSQIHNVFKYSITAFLSSSFR